MHEIPMRILFPSMHSAQYAFLLGMLFFSTLFLGFSVQPHALT